ncbi:MAG TPA: thymidine phosphorylase family protein [Vineibacter sp.]|nr:thymidine phosphorylase family protein [Vineibacter sp.]
MTPGMHSLRLRRLGIDTHEEAVVYMRQDCHICRSEGFSSHARIQISSCGQSIIATLNQITTDLLRPHEASLSESAWRRLGVTEGEEIHLAHAPQLDSMGHVRAKIHGLDLPEPALYGIVRDIVAGRYADVHLAAFVAICGGQNLSQREILALTRAMVAAGSRLTWNRQPIADKHCVGGLPGNRTTPIVVAIAAACGLTIPKTSSRAITSPAGTADTMETLAPVTLDMLAMRRVVEREGGCIVWGGAADLSPADDILVRVERALDLDSEGQLVASVLSKKIAAGATHLLLDVPVGPTAKVRSTEDAQRLAALLSDVGSATGLELGIVLSDGVQPVGRGIGPALEAHDVLAVLRNEPGAPQDLRLKSSMLAGRLLELTGASPLNAGADAAAQLIADGAALRKFEAICDAQGGMRVPPRAAHTYPVLSDRRGRLAAINNRLLARIAKLAGAPAAKAAGVELHVRVGDAVEAGQPLYTIHAEAPGELAYALDYVKVHAEVMQLETPP